jgi:hypothetical protein
LGYLTPLVLNFEAMFMSRRSRYFDDSMYGSLEMKEVMIRHLFSSPSCCSCASSS